MSGDWNVGQLHLGVTLIHSRTAGVSWETFNHVAAHLSAVLGPDDSSRVVNGVGLFETEMYISGMHGGHGGGKTSSFKRCIFLKTIGTVSVIDVLVTAIHARASHLCYVHLLQDGGAVADVAVDATAFGCRDWDLPASYLVSGAVTKTEQKQLEMLCSGFIKSLGICCPSAMAFMVQILDQILEILH